MAPHSLTPLGSFSLTGRRICHARPASSHSAAEAIIPGCRRPAQCARRRRALAQLHRSTGARFIARPTKCGTSTSYTTIYASAQVHEAGRRGLQAGENRYGRASPILLRPRPLAESPVTELAARVTQNLRLPGAHRQPWRTIWSPGQLSGSSIYHFAGHETKLTKYTMARCASPAMLSVR